jgi:hypothetical protein
MESLGGRDGVLRSALWRAGDTPQICQTMNGVTSARIFPVQRGSWRRSQGFYPEPIAPDQDKRGNAPTHGSGSMAAGYSNGDGEDVILSERHLTPLPLAFDPKIKSRRADSNR